MLSISQQVVHLFLLAIPIACIAWTVTHEELFKEPREYCARKSKSSRSMLARKFFYLFTCEYCFSHYVTIAVLLMTGYQLLYPGWRGYVLGGFALVWIANVYMSLFGFIRVGVKETKIEADLEELRLQEEKKKRGLEA